MEPPLIVRALSVNTAIDADEWRAPSIRAAIVMAQELAEQRRYRSVLVLDDNGMMWAQFNMLWDALEWEAKQHG